MTISVVQETGGFSDASTTVSKAFAADVAAGSLIVVVASKYANGDDAYIEADCTKLSGTATLGEITLDRSIIQLLGFSYHATAIWSAIVTAGGSLTMQVGGGSVGAYNIIGIGEYSGDWNDERAESGNTGTNTGTTADSGNATSAGAALVIGALAVDTSSAITITPDAAFATIYESEDGSAHETGSAIRRIVSSGTTDSASWTLNFSLAYVAAIQVYKEAAGGGSQALGGAAAAGATASADASVTKPLAGAATGGATAAGTLLGDVPLAGAATGGAAASASLTVESRRFQFTLYNVDGATPLANKTGLWWAWWDVLADVRSTAPDASGTGATTDASGVFSVVAPSALTPGDNQGFGIISDQDATPDATEAAYVGSFDVV